MIRLVTSILWRFLPVTKSMTHHSQKVIHPKTIKTQVNYAFCCFAPDWTIRAVLKISAVLLKYPTFESFSFNIFTRKLEFLFIVAYLVRKLSFVCQEHKNVLQYFGYMTHHSPTTYTTHELGTCCIYLWTPIYLEGRRLYYICQLVSK